MNHHTDYNVRLQLVRARKQARRDLIARVATEFGLPAAHDLLLEAATDIEDMLQAGTKTAESAPAAFVAAPAAAPVAVVAAPAAPAVQKQRKARGPGRASAPAAPAPAPAPAPVVETKEAPSSAGGGSMSALVLGVLKDVAPKKLTAPDILKAINENRPEIERGQVFETLTRLVKKRDTPLIRKGVAGKFRYTVRVEEAPPPAAPVPAEPRPKMTNNARVLEALADVGPTTDSGRLARVAFGETTTETKQKVRNALHSLLSSGKIHRREDGTWEAVSAV